MRPASARSMRDHVALAGGTIPVAFSTASATPSSEDTPDNQSCRFANIMICRKSRASKSFSALRCMSPGRTSVLMIVPDASMSRSISRPPWFPG